MSRSTTTEAVVLRSFRYSEADRVLHVYTADQGRVGAMAKGVRRAKSRFGGRLEPFSHVELVLHRGRGELQTVTGASLVRPHDRVRADPYRLQVGLVGLEAMLRLFTEQERNEKAFLALTRFLDALDDAVSLAPARPAVDPLVLSFQIKLLWLSGYLPHTDSCVVCGRGEGLIAYAPAAGGLACVDCNDGGIAMSTDGANAIARLARTPIADARQIGLDERACRDVHAVISASYEFHGGFRLKTTSW